MPVWNEEGEALEFQPAHKPARLPRLPQSEYELRYSDSRTLVLTTNWNQRAVPAEKARDFPDEFYDDVVYAVTAWNQMAQSVRWLAGWLLLVVVAAAAGCCCNLLCVVLPASAIQGGQ